MEKEIIVSKQIIAEKIGCKVDTFIYPKGRVTKKEHAFVKQHYRYAMQISNALNGNWEDNNSLISRINGDGLMSPQQPFLYKNLLRYYFKFLCNKIR